MCVYPAGSLLAVHTRSCTQRTHTYTHTHARTHKHIHTYTHQRCMHIHTFLLIAGLERDADLSEHFHSGASHAADPSHTSGNNAFHSASLQLASSSHQDLGTAAQATVASGGRGPLSLLVCGVWCILYLSLWGSCCGLGMGGPAGKKALLYRTHVAGNVWLHFFIKFPAFSCLP